MYYLHVVFPSFRIDFPRRLSYKFIQLKITLNRYVILHYFIYCCFFVFMRVFTSNILEIAQIALLLGVVKIPFGITSSTLKLIETFLKCKHRRERAKNLTLFRCECTMLDRCKHLSRIVLL